MNNSLLVNTYIRTILLQEDSIRTMLTDSCNGQIKIFPIAAKSGTDYPYVTISRDSIMPQYSKDGCYGDMVNVTLYVVHPSYDTCVQIANLIRNKLDLCMYRDNDVFIDRIVLTTATEGISDDCFVQELVFNVSIANNN